MRFGSECPWKVNSKVSHISRQEYRSKAEAFVTIHINTCNMKTYMGSPDLKLCDLARPSSRSLVLQTFTSHRRKGYTGYVQIINQKEVIYGESSCTIRSDLEWLWKIKFSSGSRTPFKMHLSLERYEGRHILLLLTTNNLICGIQL